MQEDSGIFKHYKAQSGQRLSQWVVANARVLQSIRFPALKRPPRSYTLKWQDTQSTVTQYKRSHKYCSSTCLIKSENDSIKKKKYFPFPSWPDILSDATPCKFNKGGVPWATFFPNMKSKSNPKISCQYCKFVKKVLFWKKGLDTMKLFISSAISIDSVLSCFLECVHLDHIGRNNVWNVFFLQVLTKSHTG